MICISFDSDHMNNSRMEEWLATISIPGGATMFCTEYYSALEKTDFEIGPHPELSPNTDWSAEIKKMRELFPKAKSWRSHSLVFSQLLAIELPQMGYERVSTSEDYFNPQSQISFNPWGVYQFPVFYMDNADFDRMRRMDHFKPEIFDKGLFDTAIKGEGTYVFDFHPIHIMLNTPNFEFYSQARDKFKAGEPIETLRYEGYGVGSYFKDLCDAMKVAGVESKTFEQAHAEFVSSSHVSA